MGESFGPLGGKILAGLSHPVSQSLFRPPRPFVSKYLPLNFVIFLFFQPGWQETEYLFLPLLLPLPQYPAPSTQHPVPSTQYLESIHFSPLTFLPFTYYDVFQNKDLTNTDDYFVKLIIMFLSLFVSL
ncbi:hypothetical protein ES708_13568 [subsurface metagenome]